MTDLLLPHTGTAIWMLISFLTVFFLLKKFAWKPILNALKQREASIENALLSAETMKKEMTKLKADNEKILSEARRERDKIIKEARNMKDSMINEAKEQAVFEAKKIIESARVTIRSEKESAVKELKQQSALLSLQIAEKLLKEKLGTESEQKALIEKILPEVKMN